MERLTLWRVVKWGFLGLFGGTLVVAAFFVWRAETDKQLPSEMAAATQDQRAHVDKPLIIERKSGKILWRLKAGNAQQELKGEMHLTQPELELFTETGRRIPITGREAWFNPLSKSIRFHGDVVMHYGEWVLYSEDVRYDHGRDTVRVPGKFRLVGRLTRARGRDMTAWRGKNHVHVAHAVWIEDRHPYKEFGR